MGQQVSALPFLTAGEIDEMCAPLVQRRAQYRRLCQLLGQKSLPRRPDGLPLVGRRLAEDRLNSPGAQQGRGSFNWSK